MPSYVQGNTDRRSKRVYAWEAQWRRMHFHAMTIQGVRSWVKWACQHYDVPVPVVRGHRLRQQTSFYRLLDKTISMKESHYNIESALHEAAHAIFHHYYGDTEDHHGPKWLGIYVHLLEASSIIPRSALRPSLAQAGITFSHMMTPKVLKRKKPQ